MSQNSDYSDLEKAKNKVVLKAVFVVFYVHHLEST